jgi:quercetin dioxygenase-like cupin family protein
MPSIPTIANLYGGEWKEHPRFKQILMKQLLTAEDNPLANVNTVLVPPGGTIGGHTHGIQVETICILAGNCILTIEDEQIPFEAGQIIAMPAGVPHSLYNPGVEDVQLLTFFTPPI